MLRSDAIALICPNWVKLSGRANTTAAVCHLCSQLPHSATEPRASEDVPQLGPPAVARLLQGVPAAPGASVSAVAEVPPALLR